MNLNRRQVKLRTSSARNHALRSAKTESILIPKGSTVAPPLGVNMPLLLILLFQASIPLFMLHNTAFQDEALYLLAGRQIFLGWLGKVPYVEPYGLYFSGYPSLYPVIAGLLDFLGGLETARLFSLLCMLTVTTCIYFLTTQLFNRASALIAAILFACEGSVLFLGRLATYDSLCLCLLALTIMLSLRASKATSTRSLTGIGPLLVLMVAAKYAGLLFVPTVITLLTYWCHKYQGSEEMLARLVITFFWLGISCFFVYLYIDKQVLTGLSFTTTNRVDYATPAIVVIQHIAMMEGIFFALAFLGLLLSGRHWLPTSLLFFGSSLLVPLYHTYKGEMVSLDKHLAFSMFFLAPLAGFAIASLVGLRQKHPITSHLALWQKHPAILLVNLRQKRPIASFISFWQKHSIRLSWFAALTLCLLTLPLGLQQAQNLYDNWPSSTQLTTFLRPRVHLGTGHYLAEDYDVLRYNLKNETAIWQWSSLDYFVYTDKAKHHLSGEAAYKAAIQEGFFDLIELSYGYHTPLATQLDQTLTASKHYDLLTKIPCYTSYGQGYFWLWRKHTG